MFVKKAIKIHGNKYDYSLVNYKNAKTKIKIICSIHGIFEQTPSSHLSGRGCPKCNGNIKLTTDEFIKKAKKIHGDKYDYSLVDYKNMKTKVKIICPIHGVFEQNPDKHLDKNQCPKCSKKYMDIDYFIKKSKKVHGNKYNYSLVDYKNMKTKVKIICPIHGIFEQTPDSHLQGQNCPKCSKKYMNTNYFIEKSKLKHGNKYDYSLVDYKNTKTKVKIICPTHGVFEQIPDKHLQGHGCSLCTKNKKYTTKEFIKLAKTIHGNKYDYSLTKYHNSNIKINIICPKHGIFKQAPKNHLIGNGCPICKIDKSKKINLITKEEYIKRANLIHNNKYDYSLLNYKSAKEKIKIVCPIHKIFEQEASSHLSGCGCPKCSNLGPSKLETEINDYIRSLNINTIISNRKILNYNQELDIYIPDKNIAIEFNGLYYHSEQFKNNDYHLNKTIQCENKGIQLIHIFEDEWTYKKDIVKSRLNNLLNSTKNKIYARKTTVKEINSKLARNFMNNNHLQSYTNSNIKLGLFYNNELVSVMLFNKPRKGIGNTYDGYELSRFANKLDTNIIGGASKLLKYFERNYKPNIIKSYADRRWSTGELYKILGFKLSHINPPNYWYIFNHNREHRFKYRKSLLIKEGYDSNKTEKEIMYERNINRIYDCGTLTYIKTTI